ncbi:putative disease resistance protein RGA4-like [Hibiscus syriacus]|uniref:Disease resistance protein RGA4-like n=1 Tax=Hibiscus syriacus TaxID=106335 RepID=A0A6A2XWP9_HIBSY|nr:structure-specific endonuclease subunit slx1-like [Hibiscus syriacus]KAE8660727.1 putative disease resistance protein RGA4-like [Hibiscus syriacus]
MRLLTASFRAAKSPYLILNPNPNPKSISLNPPLSSESSAGAKSKSKEMTWCVYLILSTNAPIKTYVGVTNNFSRRLKQHNGELSGGAKASRAGRPWVCACLIRGFNDRSEACEFDSKWKMVSRKLPRKRKNKEADDCSPMLLQHRETSLNKVIGSLDCGHLEIEWQMSTS